jgi:hypothetical protein
VNWNYHPQITTEEEQTIRAKPKPAKPKPDPRKSMFFGAAPLEPVTAVPVKAPQPAPEPVAPPVKVVPKVEPALSPSGNQQFTINPKWQIQYDELEFDELVSAGSGRAFA